MQVIIDILYSLNVLCLFKCLFINQEPQTNKYNFNNCSFEKIDVQIIHFEILEYDLKEGERKKSERKGGIIVS